MVKRENEQLWDDGNVNLEGVGICMTEKKGGAGGARGAGAREGERKRKREGRQMEHWADCARCRCNDGLSMM